MALTFVDLQTEFFARGLDYLNDSGAGVTRTKRLLNDSYHQINDLADWPYLNATTAGTSPLTIADLRRVGAVVDTTNSFNPLRQRSREELAEWVGDLTTTGRPSEFYVTGGNTITVYPVSTATLSVTYWKTAPDMVANGDVPLIPDRYRMAIVEYAIGVALRDESPELAAQAVQSGDVIVDRMRGWANDLQPGATYVGLVGDDQ